MKIATYNIWNNDFLFKERIEAICNEINEVQADIICLQEVRNDKQMDIIKTIADYANYPFYIFKVYPDCIDEGLAILSKFELNDVKCVWETNTDISNYCAIRVLVNNDGKYIGITNLHLNWRSEDIRLEQLKEVNNWININCKSNCNEIMCGDFNDVPSSSIYKFLTESGWYDALKSYQDKKTETLCSFDLVDNPYLKNDVRPKEKLLYDWIMVNNSNVTVKKCNVFGHQKLKSNVVASDHYGIYIEI
ncbi:Endonuclease/Exonuclease/phosphatase family protein [compost metagenome]